MRFGDDLPPPSMHDLIEMYPRRIPAPPSVETTIHNLLAADWNDDDSLLQLSSDLSEAEVSGTLFYDQARRFLDIVGQEKGVPLTARNNLNRATVLLMCRHLHWADRIRQRLERIGSRRFVESDVYPLYFLHDACYQGGLVMRRKGRLLLSRKGRALCREGSEGGLYGCLFHSLFQYMDMEDMVPGPEVPFLQQSIGVILWRLSLVAGDWIEYRRLPEEVLLAAVRRCIAESYTSPLCDNMDMWTLRSHVIKPLVWFGLLESDEPEDSFGHDLGSVRVRKTPLFDRFLHFGPPRQ